MSISAQELMIGNKVRFAPDSPAVTIYQIRNRGVVVLEDNKYYSFNDLLPIILSPDILEQCGFTNKGEIGYNIKLFEIKILNIVPDQYEEDYFEARILFGMSGPFTIAKHIRYLHEVQNIFHSLSGTELNINL